MGVLSAQSVREVPVGQLNRQTSAVVGAVEPGERLVVTRHAEPLAIVFSVLDAMELLVEGERSALAAAAQRDLESSRVEGLGRPGPLRVWLASAAAGSCERMNAHDRRLASRPRCAS